MLQPRGLRLLRIAASGATRSMWQSDLVPCLMCVMLIVCLPG